MQPGVLPVPFTSLPHSPASGPLPRTPSRLSPEVGCVDSGSAGLVQKVFKAPRQLNRSH